jgi:hypothetical protein
VRVGFTGHQSLPERCIAEIERELRMKLEQVAPGLTGLSCLAVGADQMFAIAVLNIGGTLEVVVPSAGYETTFPEIRRAEYERLLGHATQVHQLPFDAPSEESFLAAGKYIVDHCDRVLAIWDGKDAVGLGGTGDIVKYARERAVKVDVIWPSGLVRD